MTIEEQLRELAQMSADEMGRDLVEVWQDEPAVPRRVRELVRSGSGGPHQLAEVLWDYWDAALEPFWNRICAVLEDDVFHRVAAQMNSGLFTLLEGLHPEVSLEGELLHVDKPHHTSATYHGREMDLTPSVFAWPGLILRDGAGDRFGLTYAARGVARVWEGLSVVSQIEDDPLAALLGRTRAAILEMTNVPISTTQVARELGQSAGTGEPASLGAPRKRARRSPAFRPFRPLLTNVTGAVDDRRPGGRPSGFGASTVHGSYASMTRVPRPATSPGR